MEINLDKREIKLDRKLNELDNLVIDFCRLLDDYVVVSGYVSILFGRARATEDIDLLIPALEFKNFEKLWARIEDAGFECINTSNPLEAFEMLKEHAIRFSRKDKPIPNIEFKIIKDGIGEYSINNKLKIILKKGEIFISPIEMQIVYKRYYLGSNKDIEDAIHLEKIFEEHVNESKINKLKKFVEDIKENGE